MARAQLCVLTLFAVVTSAQTRSSSTVPIPKAFPRRKTVPQNQASTLRLFADVPVSDYGELNWPIHVPDDFPATDTVEEVSVSLYGLWHSSAPDTAIVLRHSEATARLSAEAPRHSSFGERLVPVMPSKATTDRLMASQEAFRGDGVDLTFADVAQANLALGKPTAQSSTLPGGGSDHAVDGDVSGFMSRGTVTHTGSDEGGESEPWWQVELAPSTSDPVTVAAVRLWARVREPDVDEVQSVSTTAVGPIQGGTFRLRFSYDGEQAETAPISVWAVARRTDELAADEEPVPGASPGESVQSRLEALPLVGRVLVTRTPPGPFGQRTWTVTFLDRKANVNPLVPFDIAIAAGTGSAPNVTVSEVRRGSSNAYYNYNGQMHEVRGSIDPAVVMLHNGSMPSATGLATARAQSAWSRGLHHASAGDDDKREFLLHVEPPVQARSLRVQLPGVTYLSLAEVEAFSNSVEEVSAWPGGRAIPSSQFNPRSSMARRFAGTSLRGPWLLSISDMAQRRLEHAGSSRPVEVAAGTGALSTWALSLKGASGLEKTYFADVMFQVTSLPNYGALHEYNASAADGLGPRIAAQESLEAYRSECYGDCSDSFGVGINLSTDPRGSTATSTNRISMEASAHSVVYVPNSDFVGADFFEYRVLVGGALSEPVRFNLNVHRCRGAVGLAQCLPDRIPDVVSRKSFL